MIGGGEQKNDKNGIKFKKWEWKKKEKQRWSRDNKRYGKKGEKQTKR